MQGSGQIGSSGKSLRIHWVCDSAVKCCDILHFYSFGSFLIQMPVFDHAYIIVIIVIFPAISCLLACLPIVLDTASVPVSAFFLPNCGKMHACELCAFSCLHVPQTLWLLLQHMHWFHVEETAETSCRV